MLLFLGNCIDSTIVSYFLLYKDKISLSDIERLIKRIHTGFENTFIYVFFFSICFLLENWSELYTCLYSIKVMIIWAWNKQSYSLIVYLEKKIKSLLRLIVFSELQKGLELSLHLSKILWFWTTPLIDWRKPIGQHYYISFFVMRNLIKNFKSIRLRLIANLHWKFKCACVVEWCFI